MPVSDLWCATKPCPSGLQSSTARTQWKSKEQYQTLCNSNTLITHADLKQETYRWGQLKSAKLLGLVRVKSWSSVTWMPNMPFTILFFTFYAILYNYNYISFIIYTVLHLTDYTPSTALHMHHPSTHPLTFTYVIIHLHAFIHPHTFKCTILLPQSFTCTILHLNTCAYTIHLHTFTPPSYIYTYQTHV